MVTGAWAANRLAGRLAQMFLPTVQIDLVVKKELCPSSLADSQQIPTGFELASRVGVPQGVSVTGLVMRSHGCCQFAALLDTAPLSGVSESCRKEEVRRLEAGPVGSQFVKSLGESGT